MALREVMMLLLAGYSGAKLSTKGTADIILGITASLITIALHLQHVPTVWKIFNANTTGLLFQFPYMFAYWNSVAGIMYSFGSLSESRKTASPFQVLCLHISSNIGFFIEFIYLMIFLKYNRGFPTYKSRTIHLNLSSSFFFMLSPLLPNPLFLALNATPLLAGIGILMYVSPVSTIIHLSRTKQVEYLPFRLLMTMCLNGLAWTIYACLPQTFNRYLAISNGIGTICAVFLLGVSYFLRFKSQKSIPSGSAHDKLE